MAKRKAKRGRKSGRLTKREIKKAGGIKQAWAARRAKSAHGKTAARTTKRRKARKGKARRRTSGRRKSRGGSKGKAERRGKGRSKSGSRSSSRSSHRSSTRVVKQTIVKHVPSGGLLVTAPNRRGKRKSRKGKGRRRGRKGTRRTGRKSSRRRSSGRRGHRGAMENPMSGTELFVGAVTGALGFLAADAIDRALATHALTDKGTKDANGNELYADSPPTTGDYAGLFNATAICAPMDAKRWIVGGLVTGVPLVIAHFISAPTGRAALQFFGFAAGIRIVGKGLTDLVATVLQTNPVGQRLYDGEMRAAVLKANNGNQAAAALASLPSAGLGRTPRLGAGKPCGCANGAGCAKCATGAGYPSMPRETAAPAVGPAPTVNTAPTPATQLTPPPAPPPPPPPAAPSATSPANTLTGAPRSNGVAAPKRNPYLWGHQGS